MPISELDEATLACEYLGREFTAVFPCHGAFDAFDDGGDWGAIVLELLGTIDHPNASLLADVFVVGTFVGVLEPSPSTDVID